MVLSAYSSFVRVLSGATLLCAVALWPQGQALSQEDGGPTEPRGEPSLAEPLEGSGAAPAVDDDVIVDPVNVTYSIAEWPRLGADDRAVSDEDLQQMEYDDAQQVVEQVPGVQVRTEDGYGLRVNLGVRGVTSDRSRKVTLMEDGVLFGPAPYAAPAAYYFPLMTRMRGVELFTGPGMTLYGPNSVGGAVDLLPRLAPEQGTVAMLDLAGGLDLYRKAHGYVGTGGDRFGVLFEGLYLGADGFKELDGGGDTGFDRAELRGVLRWNTDPELHQVHRLTLRGGVQSESSNETYLGLSTADLRDTPDRRYAASGRDRMDWLRWEGRADYRFQLGSSLRWTTSLYRHQLDREWGRVDGFLDGGAPSFLDVLADPTTPLNRGYYEVLTGVADATAAEAIDLRRNGRQYVSQGAQSALRFRRASGDAVHDLEAGLRVHGDRVERDHRSAELLMLDGRAEFSERSDVTVTDNTGSATALAIWGLYVLQYKDWRLLPGVRAETIRTRFEDRLADETTSDTQAVVLPALGLEHQLAERWRLSLAGRRGFSPATPSASPSESETSWNGEFGLTYEDDDRATFVSARAFVTRYMNLIGTCSGSTGCDSAQLDQEFAGGAVRIAGLEGLATAEVTLSSRYSVPIRGTYTLTSSSFLSDFESAFPLYGDVEQGDELPQLPRHQLSGSIGISHWRWQAAVSASGHTRTRDVAGSGDGADTLFADPQFHLDVAASSMLTYIGAGQLELYGRLDNVTNSRGVASYRPFGARPGKPFGAVLGLRWQQGE
jgi:Fe(3+) dicitrate transport protein